MPLEDIKNSQKQGRLLQIEFSKTLNPKNKLYKLRKLINWQELEGKIINILNVKKFGRNRKAVRVMLGLSMLQSMYNCSDSLSCEELQENMYWQYFCGYEWMESDRVISESTIKRFRDGLGEEGYNIILEELIKVGVRVGVCKKKDLGSAIVDTTVQIKNIKYPHDAILLEKARSKLVKLCHGAGLKPHETYALEYKRSMIRLWRYKQDSKASVRKKIMKRMKIRLGRMIRVFERKISSAKVELAKVELETLSRIKAIHAQSFLNKTAKEKYKTEGNKIIYSFHAPEAECIGKGKLNKPYEFGNKVGIGITSRKNFILAVKSFHGNPYDGHTLKQTAEQIEKNTEQKIKEMFVDLGYRGNNYVHKSRVYTPATKKKVTAKIKALQKRRSSIEPVIGHLKNFGRMSRNYLKGIIGDIINPLISAIGFNLRSIANKLVT